MAKDERGYIVVETIGTFLLFTLLIVSILTLISIVTVQARIHYAITQACETFSMYSYVLDLTGASEHIQKNSAKAGAVREHVDEFKENVNGLLSGIENLDVNQIEHHGEAVINQVETELDYAVEDPKQMVQYLLNFGADEGMSAVFEQMVRPLVGRYLSNGNLDGDQYLKQYGIKGGLDGLDFYDFTLLNLSASGEQGSHLLDADGNVKIEVQYDVDYSFGALVMPFNEPKLHVTQMVKTKAWLGGEGEGYRE